MKVGERGPSNRTIIITALVVSAGVVIHGVWVDRSARPAPKATRVVKATWKPRCATITAAAKAAAAKPAQPRALDGLYRNLSAIVRDRGAERRTRALAATATFLELDPDTRVTFVAAAPAVLDQVRAALRVRLATTRSLASEPLTERAMRTRLAAAQRRYRHDLRQALKRLEPFLDDRARHAELRDRLEVWAESLATLA